MAKNSHVVAIQSYGRGRDWIIVALTEDAKENKVLLSCA